ncbi:MAG: Mut7-C RNAse domain-containing protein [bacterium]
MAKKFICNGMLGRLCKLLRICGIDTAYTNHGIAILLEARKENRIILTRNTRLGTKKKVFFVEDSKPVRQLEHIISEYDLQDQIAPFSRCIECNRKLRRVEKNSIKDKIPFFTYRRFDEFAICPNCQRIYWKGSHYQNMTKNINHLLPNAK